MPPLYSGTNAAIINRPDFNNILQINILLHIHFPTELRRGPTVTDLHVSFILSREGKNLCVKCEC